MIGIYIKCNRQITIKKRKTNACTHLNDIDSEKYRPFLRPLKMSKAPHNLNSKCLIKYMIECELYLSQTMRDLFTSIGEKVMTKQI